MLRKKARIIRKYLKHPLYQGGYSVFFWDNKNKQEYSYLLGCVGAPALKRWGFGMILAVDRNPDPKLENSGTDNRHIRVLDELEELDFRPLILACAKMREKWTGGKGSREDILNQIWWSGPINEAHNRALVKINENFRSSEKPTLYLSGSESDFREATNSLYDNMLSLVLSRQLKGYMNNFRAEDTKKPDAEALNPAISALARGVYYLTCFQPWSHPWWQQNYHDQNPWDEASFLPDGSDMWAQPGEIGNRVETIEQEVPEEYNSIEGDRYCGIDEYDEYGIDDGGEMPTMDD